MSGAGSLAAGGNLSLSAVSGIGSIAGPSPIRLGTVSGNVSATNATSGDLFLSTSGAVTLGVAGFGMSEWGNGTLRVDSGGLLTIGGDVSVGGAGSTGSIALNAAGAIARTTGTVSANSVSLGLSGATSIGTALAHILVSSPNAGGALSATSSSGGIWIDHDKSVTVSQNMTGPAGVTLTMSAAGATFTQTAGTIDGTDAAITITADKMALSGGTIGSAATDLVTLRPSRTLEAMNLAAAQSIRLLTPSSSPRPR